MDKNLRLNEEDKNILRISRFFIFIVFIIFSVYFSYRLLFPSEYFTQSFENMNSLKNTITDVYESGDSITFFASTPQDFSEIKVEIEIKEKSEKFENSNLNVRKSYKSFFYPEAPISDNDLLFNENSLVASAESIFVVGNGEKTPFDNPLTFTGLGYLWENIEDENIDLSTYEKGKLMNITSSHPDGTVLLTDGNKYYLISEGVKKEITLESLLSKAKRYKNNIAVQEESLIINENCQLKKNFIFKKKYTCTMPIEKISAFNGKDYLFELSSVPSDTEINKIDLEFKKTLHRENLSIFIAEIKSKVKARFTGEKL